MKAGEAGRVLWKSMFGKLPELDPGQFAAFRERHPEGSYTLLDVRQPGEYEKEHLPGALLIPLPQLLDRLDELDPDKPLVAY